MLKSIYHFVTPLLLNYVHAERKCNQILILYTHLLQKTQSSTLMDTLLISRSSYLQ